MGHFTTSQRAAYGAELANLKREDTLKQYQTEGPNDPSEPTNKVTLQEAADMMGVGRKTVVNAKRRMVDDPEAHEAAKRGIIHFHGKEIKL